MQEAPRGNFEFSEALGAGAGIENRGNGWLQSKPNASTSVLSARAASVVNSNSLLVDRHNWRDRLSLDLHQVQRISWFILTFAVAKDI